MDVQKVGHMLVSQLWMVGDDSSPAVSYKDCCKDLIGGSVLVADCTHVRCGKLAP